MDIIEIKNLALRGATGQIDTHRAQVGSSGYGFVYFDFSNSLVDPIFNTRSGKVCGAGAHFGDFERYMKLEEIKFDQLSDTAGIMQDIKHDLILAGSLKTLLPDLEFGGDEQLFDALMFVVIPDDFFFPANFYYGPSGTALGGWMFEQYQEFPDKISKEFNLSPFDLDKDGLTGLVEAQMFALKRIPISDFCGIYRHDLGSYLMCVHNGVANVQELGFDFEEEEVEIMLRYYGYDFEQDKFNYREMVKRAKKKKKKY